MVQFLFGVAVAAVAFIVFTVVDCAWIPRHRIRALNRPVWIILVLVLPVVGALLWYLLGRASARGSRGVRPVGPDDDPDFLGGGARPGMSPSEKAANDALLRNLEQQFADRDDEPGTPPER